MRIATPMRGCQCFPSFRHKEINKNTLREALPFLFWKPRDVTTLCATFASQDGGVLSSQLFCLIFIIILEVSVNIDINCGCESLHNNTQVKLVEYYVKLAFKDERINARRAEKQGKDNAESFTSQDQPQADDDDDVGSEKSNDDNEKLTEEEGDKNTDEQQEEIDGSSQESQKTSLETLNEQTNPCQKEETLTVEVSVILNGVYEIILD